MAIPFDSFSGWSGGARLPQDASRRLVLAVALSALLHAVILLGVRFKFPDSAKLSKLTPPLEVVLVNSRSAKKPRDAEALAQANLNGGGNTEEKRRATNPLPLPRQDAREIQLRQTTRRVKELEQEAKKLMTRIKEEPQVAEVKPEPKPTPGEPLPAVPSAAELMQKGLQIARLEAQVEKDWSSYQRLPRRRFIGARTEEYRFARYVEDWRLKVERIGNLNYPEAAKQRHLYGSLQLTVSIRSDGSVDSVEINRSSGHKILDQAALRIVQLAAPFAPFPPDIRKDTDILSITRTWIFTRSDQLMSE